MQAVFENGEPLEKLRIWGQKKNISLHDFPFNLNFTRNFSPGVQISLLSFLFLNNFLQAFFGPSTVLFFFSFSFFVSDHSLFQDF